MLWSKTRSHPIPEAEIPGVRNPDLEFRESVRRHADTLAAGLALSEKMRGLAEVCRVINGTKSRNDYDNDARTIDALIALAATNNLSTLDHHDYHREAAD